MPRSTPASANVSLDHRLCCTSRHRRRPERGRPTCRACTRRPMGSASRSVETDNVGYTWIRVSGRNVEVCERGLGESPWDPRKQVLHPGFWVSTPGVQQPKAQSQTAMESVVSLHLLGNKDLDTRRTDVSKLMLDPSEEQGAGFLHAKNPALGSLDSNGWRVLRPIQCPNLASE